MPRRLDLLLVAVAVLAASGCGGSSAYTVEPSRACLHQTSGIVVRRPPASDLIASTALGGALNVKFAANQVTVAFGEDVAEANRLAMAYRRFRGKNIGIESALQLEKNVVLVWGVTPADPDRRTIVDCLKS